MQTMLKCDCGKEFDKQGKLNLHKYHCGLRKAAGQAKPNVDKCEHQFRLLNPRSVNEYNAMQSGYGEVCAKCQDLQ